MASPHLEPFRRHRPSDEWFERAYGTPAAVAERGQLGMRWPQLSRLADADRERVHELVVEYGAESHARSEKHRERLRRVACRLGRAVACGETTVQRANGQLEALMKTTQPGPGLLYVLPWREAEGIVDDAYATGVREARRGR